MIIAHLLQYNRYKPLLRYFKYVRQQVQSFEREKNAKKRNWKKTRVKKRKYLPYETHTPNPPKFYPLKRAK